MTYLKLIYNLNCHKHRWKKNMLFTIFSFLLHLNSLFADFNPDWKKIETKDNVEIFRGDIIGSKIVAFRGASVIGASMPKVLSVIHDVSRMKEWMSDIKEVKLLERTSQFEKIEYNRTKAPWPLSDRDFVYETKINVDKALKSVEILIKSIEHKDAPEVKGVIRGELFKSRYFLKSLNGGEDTYLEVEILADPKGSVPKWVVNLFQSKWPVATVNGIRKIALEENFKIHPDIEKNIKDIPL
jgi:hypothetical protein